MQDSLWGTPRRSESWRQAQSGRSFHKHRFVATSRLPCAISRTGTTELISTGTCFTLIMKYIHTVRLPGHQNININIVLHKVWSSVQSLWHSTLCLITMGIRLWLRFFWYSLLRARVILLPIFSLSVLLICSASTE